MNQLKLLILSFTIFLANCDTNPISESNPIENIIVDLEPIMFSVSEFEIDYTNQIFIKPSDILIVFEEKTDVANEINILTISNLDLIEYKTTIHTLRARLSPENISDLKDLMINSRFNSFLDKYESVERYSEGMTSKVTYNYENTSKTVVNYWKSEIPESFYFIRKELVKLRNELWELSR